MNPILDSLWKASNIKTVINPVKSFYSKRYGIYFYMQKNLSRGGYQPNAFERYPSKLSDMRKIERPDLQLYYFMINQDLFFIQASDYPLVDRHFICVSQDIEPMMMNKKNFHRMIHLACTFEGCAIFMNSDRKDCGASILNHHHYQIIQDIPLPILEATIRPGSYVRLQDASIWIPDYPVATIRIQAYQKQNMLDAIDYIFEYIKRQDMTVNSFLRLQNGMFDCVLVPRQQDFITTEHMRSIKAEGVGVIEMLGYHIYPESIDSLINPVSFETIETILKSNSPFSTEEDFSYIQANIQKYCAKLM